MTPERRAKRKAAVERSAEDKRMLDEIEDLLEERHYIVKPNDTRYLEQIIAILNWKPTE